MTMRVSLILWWVLMVITVACAEKGDNENVTGLMEVENDFSEDVDFFDSESNASRYKRKSADYYSDTDSAPAKPRFLLFTGILYSSMAFIVIELLVTLYGPCMKDCPLRWHTLNYCCWNCFQLFIFANCGEESEFNKFLKNAYISEHCEDIQRMTLAIYYHSMFFVIPAELMRHFCPNTRKLKVMKYYVWIPLLFTLDMAMFFAYSSEPWEWYTGNLLTGLVPIRVYQAAIAGINYLYMFIMFIALLCSIGQYGYYYCQYSGRPDSQIYKRFIHLLNFLLFFVYYILITIFHAPPNGIAMGTFLSQYIAALIKPFMDIILPIAQQMLSLQQLFTGLVPTAEFFVTFICLKMFRTQLLQCLSCGQNLHKPKKLTHPIIPNDETNLRRPRASVALESAASSSERLSSPERRPPAIGGYFKNEVSPMPPSSSSLSTTSTAIVS